MVQWLPTHAFITTSYQFPSAFEPTGSSSINTILAEIPFFAVGLLASGVFTFFVFMKRMDRLVISIVMSALLAFLAAILDLLQTLLLLNAGDSTSLKPATSLIITRDLTLSISMGFRFLFFWCFVGPPSTRGPRNAIFHPGVSETRGDSWELWGFIGLVLKWLSLLATVGITVLQLLWRLANAFSGRGPVYIAESVAEIILSVLFMSVLLSNAIYSSGPRAVSNLVPAIAFLFGVGVAAGNIFTFAFSESIPGRFLQAVEFYILMLFTLIQSSRLKAGSSWEVGGGHGVTQQINTNARSIPPELLRIKDAVRISLTTARGDLEHAQSVKTVPPSLKSKMRAFRTSTIRRFSTAFTPSPESAGSPGQSSSLPFRQSKSSRKRSRTGGPSIRRANTTRSSMKTYSFLSYYRSELPGRDDPPPVPDLPPGLHLQSKKRTSDNVEYPSEGFDKQTERVAVEETVSILGEAREDLENIPFNDTGTVINEDMRLNVVIHNPSTAASSLRSFPNSPLNVFAGGDDFPPRPALIHVLNAGHSPRASESKPSDMARAEISDPSASALPKSSFRIPGLSKLPRLIISPLFRKRQPAIATPPLYPELTPPTSHSTLGRSGEASHSYYSPSRLSDTRAFPLDGVMDMENVFERPRPAPRII